MKSFWQKNKLLIAILLFAITATSYLYTTSYTFEENNEDLITTDIEALPSAVFSEFNENLEESIDNTIQNKVQQQRPIISQTEEYPPNTIVEDPPENSITETNEVAEKKISEINADIPVSFTVPHISYNTDTFVSEKTSVYDLMNILPDSEFQFSGKNFGSLGFFVESIGGIMNDNKNGMYWIYSINGSEAQTGISNYIIQPNDIISWDYENERL
ncbi:DUF4430 domain-containing protein [Candidatus Peregrinibacteria bacterium]|jgi:hypothetical protein|nr:DUF4430 domain-containing protein [Candidatus Peregrinibacteria bacterium]